MIETKEGRYFEAQWFVPGRSMDFMGAMYRDLKGEDARWIFHYRFRYYASNDPLEDEDEKRWYVVRSTDKRAMLYAIDQIIEALELNGFAVEKTHKLDIRSSDPNKVGAIILGAPYIHVRPTSPGGDA